MREHDSTLPSATQGDLTMLSAVLQYYSSKSDTSNQSFESIAKLENYVVKRSIVQLYLRKVTDYFKLSFVK